MDSNRFIWLNGRITKWNEALVHVTSETASRGLNVFEGMRAYWAPNKKSFVVIGVNEHLERLNQSAAALYFPTSNIVPRFKKGILQILNFVPSAKNLYLRPTIFMEKGAYEIEKSKIKMGEFISWRQETSSSSRKVRCKISNWIHISPKTLPITAKIGATYTTFRFARLEAKKSGYDEAIIVNNKNRVSETAGGSIFIAKNNKIITPPLSEGILPSITRRIVLETLCPLLSLKTSETPITVNDLLNADEVFTAGTLDEISKVTEIDQTKFNYDKSSIVNKIQELYQMLCLGEIQDAAHWITLYPSIKIKAHR